MHWMKLPSGKFLNLERVVEVGFDGPREAGTYNNPYALRAVVTYAEGSNSDWRGTFEYFDADAGVIHSYLANIAIGGGAS
jgi:hypothetical protein